MQHHNWTFAYIWLEHIPLQSSFVVERSSTQCTMPFKCWIASLSRSDEYSSMTWARWAASETAARCPEGFHPHTHYCCTSDAVLQYLKVLWSSVIALYSPYLAAYISFYPVRGQWRAVNKELTTQWRFSYIAKEGFLCFLKLLWQSTMNMLTRKFFVCKCGVLFLFF